MDETDWKKAYWDIVYNRGYAPATIYPLLQQIDQLTAKNEWQAGLIMEMEFYLDCINIVGNTVYVDHEKIQRMARFIKEVDRPFGLGSSEYCKDKK